MAKRNDTPTTNPSEIEALRERVLKDKLSAEDKQLIARLLGLFLSLIQLVEKKNASIKRGLFTGIALNRFINDVSLFGLRTVLESKAQKVLKDNSPVARFVWMFPASAVFVPILK